MHWTLKNLIMTFGRSTVVLISLLSGCTVFPEKTKIVYASLSPPVELADQVLYVATNEPIPVAIQSENIEILMDVGGWYLIPKQDLQVLLKGK